MIRRGQGFAEVPERLLRYRAADWPSTSAWREARRAWQTAHRPATLDELNAWYGPDTIRPPLPDPREVPDEAA